MRKSVRPKTKLHVIGVMLCVRFLRSWVSKR